MPQALLLHSIKHLRSTFTVLPGVGSSIQVISTRHKNGHHQAAMRKSVLCGCVIPVVPTSGAGTMGWGVQSPLYKADFMYA